MTTTESPLYTETLLGVRAWNVSATTNWELLQGYGDANWATDGEFTEAACDLKQVSRGGAHQEKAPSGPCTCGLYAAHPFEAAVRHHHLEHAFRGEFGVSEFPGSRNHPRVNRVFGVVEATGQIEVHEHGFRAEFARPIGLLIPGNDPHRHHVLDLCRRYRAHRIDSLLGETLQSFVDNRPGQLTESSVEALLEPVHRAEEELALAEEEADEKQRLATMPLTWRFKEATPRPIYWTGLSLYYLGCAVIGITLWLVIILAWILPLYGLVKAVS